MKKYHLQRYDNDGNNNNEQCVYIADYYNHRVMNGVKKYLCYGDSGNHRVMRWSIDSKEISVVAGGNRKETDSNQFNRLGGLTFDRPGNLFVVDNQNNHVQKLIRNSN
ncbi:hypothetical protein I4U23_022145 [Adineta vaga]|nr:hypothetical protein I4U23_022145 [Adineta vaga]